MSKKTRINSCLKGKRIEREWVRYLREMLGLEARRTAQHRGSGNSCDVEGPGKLKWEVKGDERLNICDAVMQLSRDVGLYKMAAAVAHKKNRGEWLVTIRALDLIIFARTVWEEATKPKQIVPGQDREEDEDEYRERKEAQRKAEDDEYEATR